MNGAYLDHASATPVRKEVLDAMLPYFSEQVANPSTVYDMGSKIRLVVEEKRATSGLFDLDPRKYGSRELDSPGGEGYSC